MRRAPLLAALGAAGLLAGAAHANPLDNLKGAAGSQDAVGRAASAKACSDEARSAMNLSPENEYWLGRALADRLLARYVPAGRPALVFEPDSVASVYVNQVGAVVASAAAKLHTASDRPAPFRGYHFIVVRDPSPNAFGLPGGFVIITDGMIMRAGSEEQVAGVLAHEVAHIQRGHGAALMEEAMCRLKGELHLVGKPEPKSADVLTRLGGSADKGAAMEELLVQLASKVVLETGYGRDVEFEADAYATRYLKQAGYSALGVADYLNRLERDPGQVGQEKTHPANQERIKAIVAVIQGEGLTPAARSSHEVDRDVRFVKMMVDSGLRPDWKPVIESARR